MLPKIHFITLAVADLEKLIIFYRDGLGLPTPGIQPGNEDHCLFELQDHFSLVLYRRKEFLTLMSVPQSAEASAGFMLSHMAHSREEVDQVLQQAVASGGYPIGPVQDEPWGYSATFADPDGHR